MHYNALLWQDLSNSANVQGLTLGHEYLCRTLPLPPVFYLYHKGKVPRGVLYRTSRLPTSPKRALSTVLSNEVVCNKYNGGGFRTRCESHRTVSDKRDASVTIRSRGVLIWVRIYVSLRVRCITHGFFREPRSADAIAGTGTLATYPSILRQRDIPMKGRTEDYGTRSARIVLAWSKITWYVYQYLYMYILVTR